MQNYFTFILILVVLPVLSFLYFTVEIAQPVDRVFLSISTFLYTIFTGFFISRQASRFNKVRETVTRFDGLMSNLYRTSGHVSATLQQEIGIVISAHYKKILKTNSGTTTLSTNRPRCRQSMSYSKNTLKKRKSPSCPIKQLALSSKDWVLPKMSVRQCWH